MSTRYLSPEWVIELAYNRFGKELVATTSFGRNSAILLHMINLSGHPIPIIHVDPGDIPPENDAYREKLTSLLRLDVRVYRPDPPVSIGERRILGNGDEGALQRAYARKQLLFKVAVAELGAGTVVSGVRAEQSSFRRTLHTYVWHRDGLLFMYPLLQMTNIEALEYLEKHELPIHQLGPPSRKENMECGLHSNGRTSAGVS